MDTPDSANSAKQADSALPAAPADPATGAILHEMQQYYADRASGYDDSMGYTHPGFVSDNAALFDHLRTRLAGRKLLEIACGPGFWTQQLASAVPAIWATDFNPAVLAEAHRRGLPQTRVQFLQADAYRLDGLPNDFSAAFFCDWWSHIPRSRVAEFLTALHARLAPGARVVILEAYPGEVARHTLPMPTGQDIDAEGNRLVRRRLPDGREYTIIKNYWSREEYEAVLRPCSQRWEYRVLGYTGYMDGHATARHRVVVEYEI